MTNSNVAPEKGSMGETGSAASSPDLLRPAWLRRAGLQAAQQADMWSAPPLRAAVREWLFLAVVVLSFCTAFLSFDERRVLPGNESEVVQSLDWTLVNSLRHFRQFPMWNPYLRSGIPFVADPFLHVYNPLATLPVLIMGVWDGFKVALALSVFAAAMGMWWMGIALRLGPAARLWMGLMYAFTGQAVARFFQGEYLFVLGYAWIPWTLAFALLAMRTRQSIHLVVAAASLTLVVFSGNVYYAFYMIFVFALLGATGLVGYDSVQRRPRWHWPELLIVVLIGLLAVGLTAVQWLPTVDYWTSYTKMADTQLIGSHDLRQIWLDYVSKDHVRPDAYRLLPSEEFYAYTGLWPFLLLAFLPLAAVSRSNRRALVFLGALLVVSVAYVATRQMPWASAYAGSGFWSQFRYQTRALILGALALIALAGCGLDAIWRVVRVTTPLRRVSVPGVARWVTSRLGLVCAVVFVLWSVADVYTTNRAHTRSRDQYRPPYEAMDWLRQYDTSAFYISTPSHGWHGPVVSNGLRYLDAWYGLEPVLPVSGATNARRVVARAKYIAMGNDRVPDPAGELVQRFAEHSIWRMPGSLPYAFTVSDALLSEPAGGVELNAADVKALEPALASPNRIHVELDGPAGETLVVLTSANRGWRLSVDGRPEPLLNVGGYLAAPLRSGDHSYQFSFSPVSFRVGAVVSLASLVALAAIAVIGRRSSRPRLRAHARGAGDEGVHLAWPELLGWILLALGVAVYLFTRLNQIDRFPITFFTDEAKFTLLAQDLLSRGLRDNHGTYLPVYFEVAGNRWTPVLAVYAQLPAVAMFGKSIVGTRATSAIVSLLAPLAVSLILKQIFRARTWWAGMLLVAVVPTWFLHSRTAFEWMTMASCYALFILFYLLYRCRSPRYLLLAIVFAAATFYNHASGQLVIAASALLLAVSDVRYHLKNWRTILLGLPLVALLAIPFVRLQVEQPGAMMTHLRVIDSYWFRDVPLTAKLHEFVSTYAYGLSPSYWLFPNQHDLMRHRMQDYGNLGWVLFPFLLVGALVCLRHLRSPSHRAVLLALLAAPAGAATADVAITRMMAFVPPACVIAGLGLELVSERVSMTLRSARLWKSRPAQESLSALLVVAVLIIVVLSGASLLMMRDALTNGATWYTDYGLYGMQYGARPLFTETIPRYLESNPAARVVVSPNWANGTDTFVRFFLPPEMQFTRVQMHDIRYYMEMRRELGPDTVLVLPDDEYRQASASPKFSSVDIEQVVLYPDGTPGFYFVRASYADDFDEVVAREREERARPVIDSIILDGQLVEVRHSVFDGGQLRNLFDGDAFTLARGLEANPLVIELMFPEPRAIRGLGVTVGSMDFNLTARLTGAAATEPVVYSEDYRGLPSDPTVEMTFDRGPEATTALRLEIAHLNAGQEVHIHVRELTIR